MLFKKTKLNPRYYLLILCIFTFLLYSTTLDNKLVHSDDHTIITQLDESSSSNIFEQVSETYIGSNYYRPIVTLSFIFNYTIAKDNLIFYHLTNVFFHIFFIVLTFNILLKLRYESNKAFWGTLILALHPLAVNSVSWIVGRNELIYSVIAIFAFHYLLKLNEVQRSKHTILLSIIFLLGMLAKETFIVVPILLFIFFKIRSDRNKRVLILTALSISFIVWILIRLYIGNFDSTNEYGIAIFFSNFRVYFDYLSFFFLPRPYSVLPTFNISNELIGLFILLLLCMAIFKYKLKRNRIILFGILWIFLTILPTLIFRFGNYFEWNDFLFTRFYLSAFGLIIILLEILKSIKINRLIVIIVLIYLSSISYLQIDKFSNPVKFYESAYYSSPERNNFLYYLL